MSLPNTSIWFVLGDVLAVLLLYAPARTLKPLVLVALPPREVGKGETAWLLRLGVVRYRPPQEMGALVLSSPALTVNVSGSVGPWLGEVLKRVDIACGRT